MYDGKKSIAQNVFYDAMDIVAKKVTDVEPIEVQLDLAVPCGLVLNELVTNAIKHGRSPDGTCAIRIELHRDGEAVVLTVSDLGPGFPPEKARSGSLGMQLIRALARQLGTEHAGATVAYFADEKDWRVWIGDASTSAFLGRPATTADLGDDGAFHATKDAFLAAAQAAGDQAYVTQKKSAPPATPPPPAQQLKLQTDALLDTLITKLEPK
jgi:anti-sigma regulatory factor (Ser/Thr protein kinase)